MPVLQSSDDSVPLSTPSSPILQTGTRVSLMGFSSAGAESMGQRSHEINVRTTNDQLLDQPLAEYAAELENSNEGENEFSPTTLSPQSQFSANSKSNNSTIGISPDSVLKHDSESDNSSHSETATLPEPSSAATLQWPEDLEKAEKSDLEPPIEAELSILADCNQLGLPRASSHPTIPLPPITPSEPRTTKLLHLEGLRGLAALIVAIHHYKQSTFRQIGFDWAEESFHRHVWHIFWDGTFSVTVFFVLSGRVLTASFLKKKGPMKSLASAIVRRPVRLGVPVAIAMAINLILGCAGAYSKTAEAARIMVSEEWLGGANRYYLITSAGDFFIFLVNMVRSFLPFLPS